MSAYHTRHTRDNSATCRLCDSRRFRDELRQGGGHNNFTCRDEAACAARAHADVGPGFEQPVKEWQGWARRWGQS